MAGLLLGLLLQPACCSCMLDGKASPWLPVHTPQNGVFPIPTRARSKYIYAMLDMSAFSSRYFEHKG